MRYLYARVSTKDQLIDRQIEAAKGYEIDKIFAEHKSGKDFNRPEYQKMKSILKKGDEVIIKDLDRLGRNKQGVKEELEWFKSHGILVRILNLPTTLMEFPQGQEWVLEMVNNILIEVMGTIAQNELETLHRRMEEGIKAMPRDSEGYRVSSRTGKRFGREKKDVSSFPEYYKKVKEGLMSREEAYASMGISRSLWYELASKCV